MAKRFLTCFTLVFAVFLLFHPSLKVHAEPEEVIVSANPGDNADNIQNLLNFNKYGNYKLTIKIPEGNYYLNNELIIYSNTTIIADPNAHLVKNHQKGSMITNDLTNDKGGYTAASNITISGGIWDSYLLMDKNKGTESFRFIHASDITVKNATICNVPVNSHLITFAGVKNGLIENCKLYGYGGSALKEAIQLDIVHDSVRVPSMQSAYIKYDDTACDGIKITGNEIYNYPRAIGSHTSIKGVFHKNIEISNNNIHDISEAAIKIYNYQDTVVSNNTIKNAAVGVLVYTYLSNGKDHYLEALSNTQKEPLPENYNITIKNNNISDMKQVTTSSGTSWGIGIRTIGCKTRPLKGVTIENNKISHTDRYGMLLQKTPGSLITKNTVESTDQTGIYLIDISDNSTVSDNTLTYNGSPASSPSGGIGLSASAGVLITGNTIKNPRNDGIFLYNKSTSCNINNNKVNSAQGSAIALYKYSNDSTIENNTLNNFVKNGIYASKVSSAVIKNNEIAGIANKSNDGICIYGVTTADCNFTVDSNIIDTAGRYGIYLKNAPDSYVGSNQISNIAKNAIYVDIGSDNSKIYFNVITYTDNTITRYNRIKTAAECKQVERYDNQIYQV